MEDDAGMSGLIGFSSGYDAMLGCDVVLMLGTDFRVTACADEGAVRKANTFSLQALSPPS